MGMKMQNDELLPCPFCGYEAFDSCFPTDYPTEHCRAYVQCKSCGAEIHRDGNVKNAKELVKECIRAWNTRKPMERIVESLENGLKESDKEKERCAKENPLQFDSTKGYSIGISNALDIVRKGGVENATN